MTKKITTLLLLVTSLFSLEIPTDYAKERFLNASVALNAQIVQRTNEKQSVTSLVSGHLKKYYVAPGTKVKAGDKIALIDSIAVSRMTAEYLSLKKQYQTQQKNYKALKELYDKGMASMQELNTLSIQQDAMQAELASLRSQLKTLNIDTKKLKVATGNLLLYAHSEGEVSELLQPLHTVVQEDEVLITIVKEQAFYVKSFVPLKYAAQLKTAQKVVVHDNNTYITTHIQQILPSVDVKTQRVIVYSQIQEKVEGLFINAYVKATLYFNTQEKQIAIKKSALSFFKNEWVVFVPNEHHEEEHKDEKSDHDMHDEHDDHEPEYTIKVVEIVAEDETYVFVKGLEINEEYVSDKSYYVKSMLLKSSLGGHGH